jgi:hypothetical protein
MCPIYFDDTITSVRYCESILYPFNGHLNDETARGFFLRDGATVHTARVCMTLLRHVFGNKIISKDITVARFYTADFYMWEANKEAAYKGNPHTT